MLKNLLLIAFSTLFGLIIVESTLQLATHDPNYYFADRYLFSTPGYARDVSDRLWLYGPDNDIREVAVYGFSPRSILPGDAYRIEYQCRFSTNNLGLIQQRDFSGGDRVTLVLGDSFLAGQVGCPWFDRLSAAVPRVTLMNGGLMGTGVVHWAELVEFLSSQGITIERILIVAISNDFKRPPWIWSEQQLACLDQGQCKSEEYWEPIELESADEAILARAMERARMRHGQSSLRGITWSWLKRNSRTVNLLVRT